MYFSDCLVFFVDTATKCTKPWQRQCAVFASATVWQGLLQLAASHQVEDLEWHAVILFLFCQQNRAPSASNCICEFPHRHSQTKNACSCDGSVTN